jgi:UDP-N-acetyl-D-glucosamine dehydrogenase
VAGSRIAVLGVSYKPGVSDIRESPALKILRLLRDRKADLVYHDPYVPELPALGLVNSGLSDALADADLAVIVTAHREVDHDRVAREVPLLLDLRGVTQGSTHPSVARL